MNTRKYLFTTCILMALGFVFYACDPVQYLDEQPRGALGGDVIANRGGVEALLIGAYAALDGQGESTLALDGSSAWFAPADNWVFGSIAGGDAHKGSDGADQSAINEIMKMEHTATNGYFNSKWRVLYEGISRTNAVLNLLKEVEDMSDSEKTGVSAEARFLRGYYYFELKKMFGNVPWIDENTTDFKQPNVGEGAEDVWKKIEEDFSFAMDNLPETQSDAGRANSWAAASYLAKAHVYQQEWQDAKDLFDVIVVNGTTSSGEPYALMDNFQDNFNPARENNSESIFSIQMVANDGSGGIANARQGNMLAFPYNSPFRCCGFFQPTQDLVNSYQTDPVTGLPLLGDHNATMVKSDMNINSDQPFTPHDGPLDPRLDWTAGRRGVPYHDWGPHPGRTWIRDQSYAGPYAPKKHVYWQATQDEFGDHNSWAPGSAINYVAYRYADLLLMAAEAEVEVGSLDQARQYVNEVRNRVVNGDYGDGWVDNSLNEAFAAAVVASEADMLAANVNAGDWVVRTDLGSTFVFLGGDSGDIDDWQEYENPNYVIGEYPPGSPAFAGQPAAREAVHFERKIELAMEGHRFFDLVRWGEAEETLNAFYDYEGGTLGFNDFNGGKFTPNRNEYYPIPQAQIDLSVKEGKPTLTQNPGYN